MQVSNIYFFQSSIEATGSKVDLSYIFEYGNSC